MKKVNFILSVALFISGVCALCYGGLRLLDIIRDTRTVNQLLQVVSSETGTASDTTFPASESDISSASEFSPEASSDSETYIASTEMITGSEQVGTEQTAEPYISPYAAFFETYPDLVAWLDIPDTIISYPVMWTPGDETYYLYRNYDGTDNQNGSLLLDTDSSLNPLTTNLIIHGHDMRSGAMFGNLTDYADPTYCEQHKEMFLFTADCEHKYEVLAVFYSQVYRKKDTVFKFYQFFEADTQEEFDYFYDNIMKLSLFDTGVTAAFGDHFITLSTCSSHVENGRFVVVAKEVTDDASTQK